MGCLIRNERFEGHISLIKSRNDMCALPATLAELLGAAAAKVRPAMRSECTPGFHARAKPIGALDGGESTNHRLHWPEGQ